MLDTGRSKIVAIGEAMIELAPVGDGLFKQGFAGDTFNTVWHIAQLLGNSVDTSFVTRVGNDKVSDKFVQSLRKDGLDVSVIGRDAERTMGLYLIELEGVERHFQYWRNMSAARHLADDQAALESAVDRAEIIHLSGITLAILTAAARDTLFDVLARARKAGARVSFDPNIRPQLWRDQSEVHETVSRFLSITDIALPSFDDEAATWGDTTPDATIARLVALGINEIALKNGAGTMLFHGAGTTGQCETPSVTGIKDTTGAGDAFNAGYLAGALRGQSQADAVRAGQALSAKVIQTFGARLPKAEIANFWQPNWNS
jgi:2-dehydro-3-deoxygluconokinase